jgi:hypothetical protein
MSDTLVIEWPKKDVDALFRAVEAAVKYLDYDIGRAIGAAARSVIRSIGASTRISPKQRKVKQRDDIPLIRQMHTYEVQGFFGRPRTEQARLYRARSLANVIKYHATISRRSLARTSWKILWDAVANSFDVSGSSGLASAAADIARIAASAVSCDVKKSGVNTSITLTNRLDYVQKALEGGPRDIDTAMERAAAGLMHSVEKQLVKRMGLGGLRT